MRDYLVSVIVPIFRVRLYIEKTIESICLQSYKNIELILINDGSDDDSIILAENMVKKYNINAKIINQENKGLPATRNVGIMNSDGEFVCFIDADDYITKDHIKNMVLCAKKKNVNIVFSDFETVQIENREGKPTVLLEMNVVKREQVLMQILKRNPAIHCSALLIKTTLVKECLFNELLRFGEDGEFMWRLFSMETVVGHCCQQSYKYLMRSGSIMHTYSYEKDKVFVLEMKKSLELLKKKYPSDYKIYDYAYYRAILGWLHSLSSKTSYKKFVEGFKLIDKKVFMSIMKDFPDIRTRIVMFSLNFGVGLFYLCLRIFK